MEKSRDELRADNSDEEELSVQTVGGYPKYQPLSSSSKAGTVYRNGHSSQLIQ